MNPPDSDTDPDARMMQRSQPESSETQARASSRSLDTAVNFKRSTDLRRQLRLDFQPESGLIRASSRSLDTAVNFKRSKEPGSSPLHRTWSLRSDVSVCSFDSVPECQDDEEKDDEEKDDDEKDNDEKDDDEKDDDGRYRPKSPSVQSQMSVNSLESEVFTFNPQVVCRRSNHSIERPPSLSGSREFNPRSPSPALSRDSGITGSSGISGLSVSKEQVSSPQYAGDEDVACDACSGRKLKAWKSCLTCIRSFCEKHGRDHYRCREMEQHQLVEVTKDLDVFKQNADLKEEIRKLEEMNRQLREELKSLKKDGGSPSVPAYISRGKKPTAADVVLDPETAHRTLVISQGGKRVRLGNKSKVQPGPQRFDRWECVIAKDGFSSGRHYWHVEVNKEFTIGVMKSSAKRNGRFAFAPFQGYWCVFHFWLSFSALENHVERLPINSVPLVLGVCVDVDERWVTFYNVDTKDQIYTFKDMKLGPGEKIYPIFRTVEKSIDLQIKTIT